MTNDQRRGGLEGCSPSISAQPSGQGRGAAADVKRRMAMAAADQVDTRAEMIAQLDEQIADLDQEMRHLQRGGTALMMPSNLIKAAELAADRRRLADERARLAGEDTSPRKPEPPQAEQKRPRGHKPKH